MRIVENNVPLWENGKGWRLSDKPTVQIGVVEGDRRYLFSRITAAALLPDGGFVIADGSETVRAYTDRGSFRWREGGAGQGPGEFSVINSIRPFDGDSLLVFDGEAARVSILTQTGRYVRSVDLRGLGNVSGGMSAVFPMADGTMMLVTGGSMGFLTGGLAPGRSHEEDPVDHIDATGELLQTLGPFPGTEWYITQNTLGLAPFAHSAYFAATDSTLVVGTTEDASVAVYSLDGRLMEYVRWPGGNLAVTKADVQAYLARGQDIQRRIPESALAGMHIPDRKPAYSKLVVDRDGNLWVSAYHLPRYFARSWSVFSPDGRLLGTVAFPDGLNVQDIGSASLLGVRTDELGVEHVALYAIEK